MPVVTPSKIFACGYGQGSGKGENERGGLCSALLRSR
jgi:hypothetical protein